MRTNRLKRSNQAPSRASIPISIDSTIHRKVVRLVSRGIFAGLIVVGCIDHVPTILAIGRIISVYTNALVIVGQYLFTANDAALAEINTLMGDVIKQCTAAVECYEHIISRD